MHYEVTFLIDGQEQTEQVDAPDAAGAVAAVQAAHGRAQEQFELIQVQFLETDSQTQSEEASSVSR